MPKNCPKCDALMELVDDDPDTGIVGGWECTNDACGEILPYESDESDYMDDAARDEANHRSGS